MPTLFRQAYIITVGSIYLPGPGGYLAGAKNTIDPIIVKMKTSSNYILSLSTLLPTLRNFVLSLECIWTKIKSANFERARYWNKFLTKTPFHYSIHFSVVYHKRNEIDCFMANYCCFDSLKDLLKNEDISIRASNSASKITWTIWV